MPDYGKTYVFVFLICFWTFATIISNYLVTSRYLDNPTIDSDLTYFDKDTFEPKEIDSISEFFSTWRDFLLSGLDDLPIVNKFVPLLRIMTFSFTETVPAVFSTFLLIISILSTYIVFSMFRGTN